MTTQSWHEFTITCPAELKEAVTGVLFELGCEGITEEEGALVAYFPGMSDPHAVVAALSGFDGVTHSRALVEEQDWYAGWKAGIGPYRTAGLLICPPWKQAECGLKPGEKLVLLDPGQAFGTGDHESTINVLGMLRSWAGAQQGLAGKRLLDLGTGTGILCIAAHIYGITDITAVDIEPRAVETAARNFALNGMVGSVRLMPGSISEAGTGYDIILANIFQEVLLALMPAIAAALNPCGTVILSGLITGQQDSVIEAAARAGLGVEEKVARGDWVSVRLSAPAPRGLR